MASLFAQLVVVVGQAETISILIFLALKLQHWRHVWVAASRGISEHSKWIGHCAKQIQNNAIRYAAAED